MKIKKLLCVLTLVISLFALTICVSAADSVKSPETPTTPSPSTSQGTGSGTTSGTGTSGSGTTSGTGTTSSSSPQTSDETSVSAAWIAVPVVLVGAAGVFTALSLKTKKEEN